MSIGNNITNIPIYENDGGKVTVRPITYREWLIGMLASNPSSLLNDDNVLSPMDISAQFIIKQADAIIKQLDKESE